jgi:hypothetical protein
MQDFEKGQILLIVVLVMVTALTIALSVAARTITNTRSSQDAASSEQAFSAAEAGIEKSLTSNTTTSGSFPNKASYSTTFINVGGTEFALNNGLPVLKDEPADLWLSTQPGYTAQRTGNVTIYWGNATDACSANEANNQRAALEIIVFSGTLAAPQEKRYAVDPCPSRAIVNNFQAAGPGGTIAGNVYGFSFPLDGGNAVNSGLFIRIIPLYAPTNIAARGCDRGDANCTPLPVQGTLIQSVGSVANTERKIQTYRFYAQLPADILQYSYFVP